MRTDWLAEYVENGESAFRIGRSGGDLVAEWKGLVRLVVGRDGSNPRFFVEPGSDEAEIDKIRRGGARVLLHHLEGKLAVHGACVAAGGRAVALLGRSGQGKSTLGAHLCEHGTDLFADDVLALESTDAGFDAIPYETNHWLDPSAMRAMGWSVPGEWKAPVASKRVGAARVPLVALVDLSYDDLFEPRLVRVTSAIGAMGIVVPQVVRFVLDDPEVQRREVEVLARLLGCVPLYRLERPRSFEHLDAAASLLLDLLRAER